MIDPAYLAIVYLLFVLKHVLGDYVFQTGWMAVGKGAATDWLKPLAAHCGIHAGLTLVVVLVVSPSLWFLAPLDFILHSAIDRTKGVITRGFKLDEHRFWTAFGLDQAAHQLTHFAYVVVIVTL